MLIAAHPDDETVGFGGHIPEYNKLFIVHLTNGSPENLKFAYSAGCKNKKEYAQLRLKELHTALKISKFNREHHYILNGVDQRVIDKLYTLTIQVLHLIKKIEPSVIITHPYEGGHPDHDCAAFIASKTVQIFSVHKKYPKIRQYEFSCYHGSNGYFETGTFLNRDSVILSVTLPEYNKQIKYRMLNCYVSQKEMLSSFSCEKERFRTAPVYNFFKAPHQGKLFYERMNWGISSRIWRRQVEAVSKEIDSNFNMN